VALANIYVLRHIQDYEGEDVENVYTFENDAGMDAQDLCLAFIEDVLPAVMAIEGGTIVSKEVRAYSLGNLSDLWNETDTTPAGYDTADTLPVFNAVGYTFRSGTRAVRPGSKRYANIPETVQIRGQITDAAYIAKMETLRGIFANNISNDDLLFAKFVIVKRVKYDVPGSDPVREAYRFPETDAELVVGNVLNVLTSRKITHQVSRGN